MESSTATAQSMRNITTTKLTALSKQREAYEADKKRILGAVANKSLQSEKVETLLDAFKVHNLAEPATISTANVQRFLKQSRHDPSIPSSLLHEWELAMEQALDIPSRKYEHASLFGRLVMEWLENPNDTPASTTGSESEDSFEQIGRKEMYDQRKEWESIVFTEDPKVEEAGLEKYLSRIFGSTTKSKKMLKTPLDVLKEEMKSFKLGHFDTDSLKDTMKGILVTDLLSEPKRKALEDFRNSPMILQEMADVLNMQIDSLESWSWGSEPVPVVLRRALNGKYRVYMDEEIVQALLLHFIGMKWAVHLKAVFTAFFHSGAWKQSSRKTFDRAARGRRKDYGLEMRENQNVRNERRDRYQNDYFMAQLPLFFGNTSDEYNDDDDSERTNTKSPMATKQSLLHLISTEALINTRLHGSFSILQSDFRWFGPSLPHRTILGVLRFFDVTPFWLSFFEKFLKAPMTFVQDGPDAPTQIRKCGVPIQHRLSDALGEAVLFCLDFAVNKSTESNLYRMHDDLWFWGSSKNSESAWRTIKDFTEVMGLTLNENKTGSVEINVDQKGHNSSNQLPQGQICWGFLKMEPTGRWTLDDKQVEEHITELQRQLSACKSIFSWVQAWNLYVSRFLHNNFGEPANCLGRPHVDMAIAAFKKVQRKVFASDELPGDNVIEHLRRKLADRFGVTDVPDAFFYFPVELGGLDLRNPFIPLLLVHENVKDDPIEFIEEAFELEEADYHKAKKAYENGSSRSRFHPTSTDVDSFMSLAEYTQYLEETSLHLKIAYERLLEAPEKDWVHSVSDPGWRTSKRATTEPYEKWVLQLYGDEVVRKYGGLEMGEKQLLPIGLVSMLRGEKVRWQG
ncbi:hypothetical protein P7C71_g4847, partial [Lecanoromycetidae sp. Uapishka_2]